VRKKKQSQTAIFLIAIVAVAVVVGAVWFIVGDNESPLGLNYQSTSEASDSTPYGESLEISLNSGAQTSTGASWTASYSDSSSQDIFTVNGTYKEQEQVTLGYSLSVTYANVESIKITSLYIKAVDNADSSEYTYTLADNKALSGASPISDSDSVVKSISQHLSDVGASSSSTIKYYIYAQVQGTGTVSGATLTATIPETQFTTLVYSQQSESANADVTPTVSVASWSDSEEQTGFLFVGIGAVLIIIAVVCAIASKNGGLRK